MASNPLTFTEIEAFCRLRLVPLSAWEVGVICRIDDAVLAVWAEEAKSSQPSRPSGPVSVKDTGGIRGLMQKLTAQRRGK